MSAAQRRWFVTACLLALTAVALGAFGAHGLRDRVEPRMLEVFEVGVRYQMFHALALLAAALARPLLRARRADAACACFVAGTAVFSGSLYAMTLTGIRALGAVTPVGGVLFLAGWVLLAAAARPGRPTEQTRQKNA